MLSTATAQITEPIPLEVEGVRGVWMPRDYALLALHGQNVTIPNLRQYSLKLEEQNARLDSLRQSMQRQNDLLRESLFQASRIELAQRDQNEILLRNIGVLERRIRRGRVLRWSALVAGGGLAYTLLR